MLEPALAPYACAASASRGRRHAVDAAPTRNVFQRDRDRIIHSSAFRRLVYKTQVFLNHEGDMFRTRLTHSLEVAQLARSMARVLRLNEDLVEAIALAHDLGHTPFGHVGQQVLDTCLADYVPGADDVAGFEHNFQSLRVVDVLEQKYPAHDGLNLCFETREGILKHCSRARALWLDAQEPGGVAQRFLQGQAASLEAQLCNIADQIAYNAHDVDDGLRSGLLSLAQLEQVPWLADLLGQVRRAYPALDERRTVYALTRRMLSDAVYDVLDQARARLRDSAVDGPDAVRAWGDDLIGFSPDMRRANRELKAFLFQQLYRHPQVLDNMARASRVMRDLYGHFIHSPQDLPQRQRALAPSHTRAVADHLASMTDRFAFATHQRLFAGVASEA